MYDVGWERVLPFFFPFYVICMRRASGHWNGMEWKDMM